MMPLNMGLWTNSLDWPCLLQFSKLPSASTPGDTGTMHSDSQSGLPIPKHTEWPGVFFPLNFFSIKSLTSSSRPCSNITFSGVHFLTLPGRINCALSVPSIFGAHFDYNTCHIILRMSDACLHHPDIYAVSP